MRDPDDNSDFDCDDGQQDLQVRQKPLRSLARPREIIVALPPMKSHVNLSRIVRAAGCFGITQIIACGNVGVVSKIARDANESVTVDIRRTLPPVLKKLRGEGYRLVALEQTDNSHCIYDYRFVCKCVLAIGNEKLGVDEETLRLVDDVVEIPTYGYPTPITRPAQRSLPCTNFADNSLMGNALIFPTGRIQFETVIFPHEVGE